MHRYFHRKGKGLGASTAGAKRVLVSAPADGADLTVVYGVNHDKLTKDHKIVSNASVHDQLPRAGRQGAQRRGRDRKGFMTTIHAYTGDQPTLDTFTRTSTARARRRCQ